MIRLSTGFSLMQTLEIDLQCSGRLLTHFRVVHGIVHTLELWFQVRSDTTFLIIVLGNLG